MTGMPFRHRSRAMAYSRTNARLRSSASIRAHLFRPATCGRRFRRGSTLAGQSRHLSGQSRLSCGFTFSNWKLAGFGRELSAGDIPEGTRGGSGEPHWFLTQAQVPAPGEDDVRARPFRRTVEGRQQGRARPDGRLGERWSSSHANSPLRASTIEGWRKDALAGMTETVATAQVRSA
jgi:hypothetical protein